MSEAERSAAPDDDRLDLKRAEDAELAWLCARRRNPDAPPPSLALAREHAQLESTLRNLPSIRVENNWHDEVLRTALRAHRRTTRGKWTAALLMSMAVVAGGTALWRPARGPELTLEFSYKQVTRGGELSASIGDKLLVTAWADSDSELRVYRNGFALLAHCPGDSRCASPGGARNEQRLELSLDVPGDYDIILVVSAGRAFAGASMDEYMSAVITAKARFVSRWLLVR